MEPYVRIVEKLQFGSQLTLAAERMFHDGACQRLQ